MNHADLPRNGKTIGSGSDTESLTRLLRLAVPVETNSEKFRAMDIIQEGPASGRLFFPDEVPSSIKTETLDLPDALSFEETAEELLLLSRTEARYYPPTQPSGCTKGWTIQQMDIDGKPAVVAWAT